MEHPDPVCRAHFMQESSSQRHVPAELLGARRSGAQILQARILSGSSLPWNRLRFPQETGIHVENKASQNPLRWESVRHPFSE
jgi:hypothetical protein